MHWDWSAISLLCNCNSGYDCRCVLMHWIHDKKQNKTVVSDSVELHTYQTAVVDKNNGLSLTFYKWFLQQYKLYFCCFVVSMHCTVWFITDLYVEDNLLTDLVFVVAVVKAKLTSLWLRLFWGFFFLTTRQLKLGKSVMNESYRMINA